MPVKYIPYQPDTIEGQAVLNNLTRSQRLLRYRESDKVHERILRGLPYYEVVTSEQVRAKQKSATKKAATTTADTTSAQTQNLVMRGECLSACAYLKEQGIKVDLVYIDPPFASGADYAKKVYIRRNPHLAEKIAAAEQEMEIDELKAFEEKMYGDIWQKEDYLNWMYENLMAIKSVMSDTGSIYVHLDWHIGHYVKILMDEVFGEDNFINEIIWAYKERESSIRYFNRKHDSIYLFTNSPDYIFNFKDIWEDYSETTIKKFKYTDENGEKYRLRYKDGRNDPTKESEDTYRQYLKDADGTLPRDWFILPIVNQAANERQDYATQKPEALLERFIKASSNEGMVVADFFGGSGVTAKVAHDLGRTFIHVDVGINSIQTTRDRLLEAGASFDLLEVRDGVSLFRNPQQTMDKLTALIPGLQRRLPGMSDFWFGAITEAKQGTVPVYVPNLLDSREKVLDIPVINTLLNEELHNLEIPVQKVIVYYIDIDEPDELQKFIRDNNETRIEVELRDLKNLLHAVVFEDSAAFEVETVKDGFVTRITRFHSDRLLQKINDFNEKGQLQSLAKGKSFEPIRISEEGLELIEWLSLDCENEDGPWCSSSEIKINKLGFIIQDGSKTKTYWDGSIRSSTKPKRLKIRNISGDESLFVV